MDTPSFLLMQPYLCVNMVNETWPYAQEAVSSMDGYLQATLKYGQENPGWAKKHTDWLNRVRQFLHWVQTLAKREKVTKAQRALVGPPTSAASGEASGAAAASGHEDDTQVAPELAQAEEKPEESAAEEKQEENAPEEEAEKPEADADADRS